jgi:N6-L-threonylcarbamoyladenine synthase/protein kinase Bud32
VIAETTLRPMRLDDLPEIHAIETEAFPTPWSTGMFVSEMSAPRRFWLVAEAGGEIVGYGGAMVIADEAHILNLAVREDRRSRGIGRALLQELKRAVAAEGAERITLEVRPSNAVGRNLYASEGLAEVGLRPGYYIDTDEAAVIMWGDVSLSATGAPMAAPQAAPRPEKDPEEALILAIESSCDETAAAVIRGSREVISSVVASQVDFHARFGGVVPEIASRKHAEAIVAVVDETLERAAHALGVNALDIADLDAVAVTYGPGLVGALVVGLAFAKGIAFATGLPLVGVNHLEGHIFANVLADARVEPPLVALVVSGGHTSLVHMPAWGQYRTLGETLDDAAGEAFDKVAKVLGLGYPGGPILSRLAEEGDPAAIDFPRAMMHSGDYAFSLSGLKTSVINHIRHERDAGREIDAPDLAASFQQAVIDVQVAKAIRAVEECGVSTFCLAGGVAANSALRGAVTEAMEARGVYVSVPPFALCTDNAAMIAAAAHYRFCKGEFLGLDADAVPNLRLDTHTAAGDAAGTR